MWVHFGSAFVDVARTFYLAINWKPFVVQVLLFFVSVGFDLIHLYEATGF